jgi:hypothetical protein
MNVTYRHEFNWWQKILQKTLGMRRINADSIDFTWGYFSPRWALQFVIHRGFYFDDQYRVSFALGWGVFHIKLPFRIKNYQGSCEWNQYGFEFFEDLLWIRKGSTNKTFYLPFKHWIFEGHWILDKDYAWQEVGKKGLPCSWDFKETDAYSETHDYTYTLKSGEVQYRKAKCTVENRRWHRKWLPWVKMERRVIEIEFDGEVGERTGSWKGGTVGCSYEMQEDETIEQCLRRMEREREFN